MKTMQDFTPEIKAKIPEYIERYSRGVFDGGRYREYDAEAATKLINWNYDQVKMRRPIVITVENPLEAQLLFNYCRLQPSVEAAIKALWNDGKGAGVYSDGRLLDMNGSGLTLDEKLLQIIKKELPIDVQFGTKMVTEQFGAVGEKGANYIIGAKGPEKLTPISQLDPNEMRKYNNDYLFTANIYSNAYAAFYKFIKDEFKVESEVGDLLDEWDALYQASGVFSAIFSEMICIVSKYPLQIVRDGNNRLHNPAGPAIKWSASFEQSAFDGFFIGGRSLPRWIWDESAAGTITRDRFLREENMEIKAGIWEVLGAARMAELLGTEVVDTVELVHRGGQIETVKLLKTRDRFAEIDNEPFAFVQVVCPSTGTNYMLGVEPWHTSAREALAARSPFSAEDYDLDAMS